MGGIQEASSSENMAQGRHGEHLVSRGEWALPFLKNVEDKHGDGDCRSWALQSDLH